MAKKSKQIKKWEPNYLERVCVANIIDGRPCAEWICYTEEWISEYRAGLIYRTKGEALACARRMLKAAKEG